MAVGRLQPAASVCSAPSGKSHVRNAILQLSSFQTGGNSLERWVLLQQPKTWVLQLGRVHLKSPGLYLPPQGALHVGLSRDLPALPGLMLTTLLPCSGWSFKTAYREIPSAKLHIKLFLSSVNNQWKAVEIHAAKQSSKEDAAEQKPTLGMFTNIYTSLLRCFWVQSQTRPKTTNFHWMPPSKPATGSWNHLAKTLFLLNNLPARSIWA